jgi:hypothetical protein
VDVLDMFINGADILLKQVGHQLLRKPDGFVFQADFNARPPVLGLVKQKLAFNGQRSVFIDSIIFAHDENRLLENHRPFLNHSTECGWRMSSRELVARMNSAREIPRNLLRGNSFCDYCNFGMRVVPKAFLCPIADCFYSIIKIELLKISHT